MIDNRFEDIKRLLRVAEAARSEERKILAKATDEGFNIFTALKSKSEHNKENFHSEIIALILNPKTFKNGSLCLKKLMLALGLQNIIFDERFLKIETEYPHKGEKRIPGRIDVFIHDNKCCIIIENKINNAPDMPNQLARYRAIAEDEHLEVLKIVYLPPTDRQPQTDNYSPEGIKSVEKTRKEGQLHVLPAIGKNSLQSILNNCAKEFTAESAAKVFLEDYSKLIGKRGIDAMVDKNTEDLIGALFSPEHSKTTLYLLKALSNEPREYIGTLLLSQIKGFAKEGPIYVQNTDNEFCLVFGPQFCTFGAIWKNKNKQEDCPGIEEVKNVLLGVKGDCVQQKDIPAEQNLKEAYKLNYDLYSVFKNIAMPQLVPDASDEYNIINMSKTLEAAYSALKSIRLISQSGQGGMNRTD